MRNAARARSVAAAPASGAETPRPSTASPDDGPAAPRPEREQRAPAERPAAPDAPSRPARGARRTGSAPGGNTCTAAASCRPGTRAARRQSGLAAERPRCHGRRRIRPRVPLRLPLGRRRLRQHHAQRQRPAQEHQAGDRSGTGRPTSTGISPDGMIREQRSMPAHPASTAAAARPAAPSRPTPPVAPAPAPAAPARRGPAGASRPLGPPCRAQDGPGRSSTEDSSGSNEHAQPLDASRVRIDDLRSQRRERREGDRVIIEEPGNRTIIREGNAGHHPPRRDRTVPPDLSRCRCSRRAARRRRGSDHRAPSRRVGDRRPFGTSTATWSAAHGARPPAARSY